MFPKYETANLKAGRQATSFFSGKMSDCCRLSTFITLRFAASTFRGNVRLLQVEHSQWPLVSVPTFTTQCGGSFRQLNGRWHRSNLLYAWRVECQKRGRRGGNPGLIGHFAQSRGGFCDFPRSDWAFCPITWHFLRDGPVYPFAPRPKQCRRTRFLRYAQAKGKHPPALLVDRSAIREC